MTENKDKLCDKDNEKKNEVELEKEQQHQKEKNQEPQQQHQQQQHLLPAIQLEKEQNETMTAATTSQQQHDRGKRLSQFLDILTITRHLHHHHHHHHKHHGSAGSTAGCSSSSTSNNSAQHSPITPHAAGSIATTPMMSNNPAIPSTANNKNSSSNNNNPTDNDNDNGISCDHGNNIANRFNKSSRSNDSSEEQQPHQHQTHCLAIESEQQQQPGQQQRLSLYQTACVSFQSEIFLLNLENGEISDVVSTRPSAAALTPSLPTAHKDEYGTQRVYKKTSPNCVLTLYLPTREITLSGTTPSILRGIVYVDPKAIQGYRVYAQLTLTFRYGREDEEVMGLRFCNEAIMSLHQIWPRNEEPPRESLSPLQEALLKRLGDGAHPFTLTLTAQAPPSVQLVPAKRYYGAPIGTSYDVRCFIADKTDEKFHRRASVKMGVRVIYRTDVFHHGLNGSENFAALINNPVTSPPVTLTCTNTTTTPPINATNKGEMETNQQQQQQQPNTHQDLAATISAPASTTMRTSSTVSSTTATNESRSSKTRKSERGDSFPKLRLSPKSFRFSSRFGRSKSEAEKCPNDPFYNYSKSFQEYDSIGCSGGPQGAVDKPFLLQDGRVGLRASLDKAWYTHGEDVCVTVNIRNDSRKTVRKVRVCAIQHVDVCMFNNGKFKNVVADSDNHSPTIDRTVAPGANLNTTVVLKPQRGPTKNWIALEDTLQRSTEPEEITGVIAASAVRTPHFLMQANHSPSYCASPAVFVPPAPHSSSAAAPLPNTATNDERNVFAIYVSYYVKVKLTLSGMGGELSLKLPFVLVHIDEEQRHCVELQMEKLALDEVPAGKKNNGSKTKPSTCRVESEQEFAVARSLDRIESVDDDSIAMRAMANSESCTVRDEDAQPSTSSLAIRRRTLQRSETIAKDIDEDDDDDDDADGEANVGDDNAQEDQKEAAQENESKLEQVIHVAQIHSNHFLEDFKPITGLTLPEACHLPHNDDADAAASHELASRQVSGELQIEHIQLMTPREDSAEDAGCSSTTTTVKMSPTPPSSKSSSSNGL